MFLDKIISYKQKVIFSVICSGFWIYFRTSDCYDMIPRHHIFPVVFVMGWTYLNYYEPLFLPIGLGVLILYKIIIRIVGGVGDNIDSDPNSGGEPV
uniref:Uncharacterized protein n=1 Tax=viral metagenome TaxID=1070528 RepID=A0A6C0HHL3_9ZZZZ